MGVLETGGMPMTYMGGGDGFGGNNGIWAILLLALLGGRGFGFNGYGGECGGVANVDNQVWQSQQLSQIDNGVRGLGQGLCDTTFALNNSIKDAQYANTMATNEAKYQLGNGICNSTFGITTAINALGSQMQDCCCSIERAVDGVNFNGERNTNAVIQANNANTQRLLDFWTNKEICEKNTALSESRVINAIQGSLQPPRPIPAYSVANPYETFRGYGC